MCFSDQTLAIQPTTMPAINAPVLTMLAQKGTYW